MAIVNERRCMLMLIFTVNTISDPKEKGYAKQLMAEYTNLHDKVEAQRIQLSAVNDNRRLLKPLEGIRYHKIVGATFDQAVACSRYLQSKYRRNRKKLVIPEVSDTDSGKFRTLSEYRPE